MLSAKWLLAAGGALTALLGGWVMYQEAMPNLRGGDTAIQRIMAMPDSGAPIGLTTLSQRHTLLDCEQVSRSSAAIEMQYLTLEERQRVEQYCADIAANIATRTPADALAWVTLAGASAASGKSEAFNTALIRSTLTGPNELPIASMRTQQAERNLAMLSPEATILHEQDLALLAGNYDQAPKLAMRYVGDAGFRERMDTILETMPPQDQQMFIFAVRSILTASGR